jgi:hypothetical protein
VDTSSLVSQQIAAGDRLIRRMLADGVEVNGAFWARNEAGGKDYLYLITPEVEHRDTNVAYGKVGDALNALIDEGVPRDERPDPFGIKLLPPSQRLAERVLRLCALHQDDRPIWLTDDSLGGVPALGAHIYIYPAKLFAPQPAGAK